MKEQILRVVKCGECFTVKSEKSEGGMLNKRTLVLQELGGKYEPTYVVSVLGSLATLEFQEGDLVIATLRFSSREYNGQMFMDVVATELIKKEKSINLSWSGRGLHVIKDGHRNSETSSRKYNSTKWQRKLRLLR